MRRLIVASALATASVAAVAQFDASARLRYGGHLSSDPPRTPLREVQVQASVVAEGSAGGLHAAGRLRWNGAYDDPAYSPEARAAYRASADWRELYVVRQVAGGSVSAGLQQEVWGRADQLRIVDTVNPVDLREFVLPDLADSRIAVPMLRASGRVGEWSTTLAWLPWFVPDRPARPGSEFAFAGTGDPQAVWLPERRPSRALRNGELGVQASRSFDGLDLSAFLFATRDDDPVFRRVGRTPSGAPVLQPEYRRRTMAGLSIARSLPAGLVLRSEWAFYPDAVRTVDRPSGDGLARGPMLDGLVGIDALWRDWLVTAQASDRHLGGWRHGDPQRRDTLLCTLAVTGSALAGRLESRFAFSRYPAGGDGSWLQLRATWKPDDHGAYTLGADLFNGGPQGVFGQFAGKDRQYLEALFRF